MSEKAASTTQVSFGQKVAFGMGMLANQMFPAALGIFMVVLVQDLGFPGWMWGILFFLPRVFDSITDPIMGFISDNTRSKWGRRRQYVFIGAIIMGISFVAMWQLYRENGITYNFTYFLLWSIVFYLGLTIFSVPYVAMGYELSDNFHERTDIMATAQWIGQWAWVIAPWFWVVMYDPDWFPNADTATRSLALWVGIGCAALAIVPAVFIKGRSTVDDESLAPVNYKTIGKSVIGIIDSFKEAFSSIPFRKLCVSTFLIFNAFNTIASFSFFIVVYYLFQGDAAAAGVWPTLFGSLGALVTTFLVIPIVAKMSKRIGKKKAFIASQSISIVGYILLWFLFVPGKPYLFILALPFFSFGIGSLFTLMMSMTADVCDLDELKSGKRREGIFGAIYWWMVKFGFAIAGLLSGAILSIVGFDATAETQTEGAITGLRLFYSGLPIMGTLIAIYVMWDYGLTEDRANDIRRELDRRKGAKKQVGYTDGNIFSNGELDGLSLPQLKNRFPQYITSPLDLSLLSHSELKDYFIPAFQKSMHGLCFSAFESDQNPGDEITEDQIVRRLNILRPHTKWIRSFSCTAGLEKLPGIARQMGFKTLVGAWISNNSAQNEMEIRNLVRLMNEGVVDIAAVGNEVLFRGELSEEKILSYISEIKRNAKEIPLGYVDVYYEIMNRPAIRKACDVILINCYPFWEGASVTHAAIYLQEMYHNVKRLEPNKKVIIAETGWPSRGEIVKSAMPSPENVMRYFIEIDYWQRLAGVEVFYFSSFDESWKVHLEGWAGSSWGLWNENEEFKYATKKQEEKNIAKDKL